MQSRAGILSQAATILRCGLGLLIGLALCAATPAAERGAAQEAKWQMRWRVFSDYNAGITFRYPYDYFIPDQYEGALVRERAWEFVTAKGTGKEIEIDGKKVQVAMMTKAEKKLLDAKSFSVLAAELPVELRGAELPEIGDRFAGEPRLGLGAAEQKLKWSKFDYYLQGDRRPHGDKAWALPGIEAMIGDSDKACGLVVKHGDRYSGIVLTGKLSEYDNQEIIDSFEILAVKSREKLTWREGLSRKGQVINANGVAVKLEKTGPVSWSRGWECETRHYHVTTQVSPIRLLEYGAYLEAIYAAYVGVYEPDTIPPFKMEVHIFNTQTDFAEAAAEHGIPVTGSTGGFFVPTLLSIFAFQEMPPFFSKDFTLEKVLAHECSHQFLHCTCNGSDHVPTWINEGLAVYFESGIFQNGKFMLQAPHERIAILKELYSQRKTTLRPLDDYLKHYGHISPDEYGEVYAMTHFWVFASKSGKDRFKLYWTALKHRENGTEAFERIFMADMIKAQGGRDQAVAAWQDALVKYVKTLK